MREDTASRSRAQAPLIMSSAERPGSRRSARMYASSANAAVVRAMCSGSIVSKVSAGLVAPVIGSRPMRWLLLGLLGLLMLGVLGCAVPRTHGRFLAAVPHANVPLPPRTKIFLVAGGTDVANFAAEVVAQRRFWLARGYASDEIACYWAHPGADDFRDDRSQYRELAAALRACYPATPALLREHLLQTSRRAPPFVYLYVSSHGRETLLPLSAMPDRSMLPGERALLDQTVIQLGGRQGRWSPTAAVRLGLHRGRDPDSLLFSPRILRDLLLGFPATTRKLVILQACHSGGFLSDPRPARQADTLAMVPGLTAIASARVDRTSFGCDSGAQMTYFGSVYLRVLTGSVGPAHRALDDHHIDWVVLFSRLNTHITALEREVDVEPSLPLLLRTP